MELWTLSLPAGWAASGLNPSDPNMTRSGDNWRNRSTERIILWRYGKIGITFLSSEALRVMLCSQAARYPTFRDVG